MSYVPHAQIPPLPSSAASTALIAHLLLQPRYKQRPALSPRLFSTNPCPQENHPSLHPRTAGASLLVQAIRTRHSFPPRGLVGSHQRKSASISGSLPSACAASTAARPSRTRRFRHPAIPLPAIHCPTRGRSIAVCSLPPAIHMSARHDMPTTHAPNHGGHAY